METPQLTLNEPPLDRSTSVVRRAFRKNTTSSLKPIGPTNNSNNIRAEDVAKILDRRRRLSAKDQYVPTALVHRQSVQATFALKPHLPENLLFNSLQWQPYTIALEAPSPVRGRHQLVMAPVRKFLLLIKNLYTLGSSIVAGSVDTISDVTCKSHTIWLHQTANQ